MPVYLFNIHGYKTWMPNHPRGYTRKGEGVFAPDEKMNQHYEDKSHFDEIRFNDARQRLLVDTAIEVCTNVGVRLYYAVCVSTHLHVLVGWSDDRKWEPIYDRIKKVAALKLARSEGVSGRRWFAHRRNGTPICTPDHFAYHMMEYLPGHRGYSHVDPKAMEAARVYTRGP